MHAQKPGLPIRDDIATSNPAKAWAWESKAKLKKRGLDGFGWASSGGIVRNCSDMFCVGAKWCQLQCFWHAQGKRTMNVLSVFEPGRAGKNCCWDDFLAARLKENNAFYRVLLRPSCAVNYNASECGKHLCWQGYFFFHASLTCFLKITQVLTASHRFLFGPAFPSFSFLFLFSFVLCFRCLLSMCMSWFFQAWRGAEGKAKISVAELWFTR